MKGKATGRDVEYGAQFGWCMVKLPHNLFREGSCVKTDNAQKAWPGKKSAQGKYQKICHPTGSQIPNALEARSLILCTGVTGTAKMFQTDRFGLH